MGLREPGAILLVSCYELGHQPLALASPLALLRGAGYRPAVLDLSVDRIDDAALAAAGLIVIAVPMHTALRLGIRLLARARGLNRDAHVCCHGLYAPLNAAALRAAGADTIAGDVEAVIVALADALDAGLPPPVPTAGLRLPWVVPDRSGLPELGRYARLVVGGERRVAGALEATRGCLHLCTHCPIPPVWHGRFVAVPRELVLEDARRQIAAGARHLSFTDPDFLNGPRHAMELARALSAEHPGVTFDCTVKVEHILRHADLWPELAAAGCVFVISAVEALSERVLEILDKGHTRADVVRALAVVRAAGISLRPTFVPFTPWTSLDDYLELCRFVSEHELEDEIDPVQLSIRLLVPPGSLLIEHAAMAPHLGPLDADAFSHVWVHPDPRMDRLQVDVAALCEAAALAHEDAAVTFARIHALALAAAGDGFRPTPRTSRRAAPPRLSEPWFC